MSVQSILEHHSACKAKHAKEGAEQKGHEAKKSHKKLKVWEQEKNLLRLVWVALMNPAGQKDAWNFPSNSADECGLMHPLDLPKSFWPCILSGFSLNCTDWYVFVLTTMFIAPWYFG